MVNLRSLFAARQAAFLEFRHVLDTTLNILDRQLSLQLSRLSLRKCTAQAGNVCHLDMEVCPLASF